MAEMAVAADLASKAYFISFPAESTPYDLLAEKGGVITRVQVKTVRRRERDGVVWRVFDCTDSNRAVYDGTVDLYAGFDPRDGRIYYIYHDDMDGRKELWLSPTSLYLME